MVGISEINVTMTGARSVQIALERHAVAVEKQIEVARDVGAAALALIQAVVAAGPEVGRHLDVTV